VNKDGTDRTLKVQLWIIGILLVVIWIAVEVSLTGASVGDLGLKVIGNEGR
jgi:hypothetical protein